MPILAVNQFGQIYATSPDREDGQGYGSSPECVDQQDLTLGSAYLKSQDRRRQELIRQQQLQKLQDERDQLANMQRRIVRAQRQKQMDGEARMYENPALKAELTKRALKANGQGMGCACEYSTPMSGNVMTANGQSGWKGMSRDQQVIHHAVTGMGYNTAHRVDPMEARALAMKQEAERILRLKARR